MTVGCEPHLVLTGKGAQFKEQVSRGEALPPAFPQGTQVHEDLGAFADFVIARDAQAKLLANPTADGA